MARIKSISSRKHRKILKAVKGFKQSRRVRIKTAKEAYLHAGQYAYVGRRLKKRDLRSLWINRITAAVKAEGVSYSRFIAGLKKSKIEIDRKIMAELAVKKPEVFQKLVSEIKK